MKTIEIPRENDIMKVRAALLPFRGEKGAVIPALQAVQDSLGYIPEFAIQAIARDQKISPSDVYGVITFYAQFRLRPIGEYLIKVCHGTACHVGGAERLSHFLSEELGIKVGDTTLDGKFTLERVACLGCCSLAPVMMVNENVHGRLTAHSIRKILKDYGARPSPRRE
jgi:NADH-quinone oxidoreductase subunit E